MGELQTPQQSHPLSPLHEPLHKRAKRDPNAKILSLQFFLRKGVSSGYVGSNQNLKDLKDANDIAIAALARAAREAEGTAVLSVGGSWETMLSVGGSWETFGRISRMRPNHACVLPRSFSSAFGQRRRYLGQ